jgi:phenylacetic acid degradation operon negative regulatory protein
LAERYEAFCFRFAPFLDGAAAALDPARAFQLCTLLIHGYRRVVLRDPQLPSRLLPQNWPGHRAFVECAMIYSQAAEQAEVHFGESLADPLTPAAQAFQIRKRRFHAASHLPAQTDPA